MFLQPENLLVESHGSQFQLKVVDFGSARTLGLAPPQVPDLEFAAPELLMEPPSISLATDVWSCAVLVYVLIR